MTSTYGNIYSRFLNKISDYEFANLEESDITQRMLEWLHSSLSNPYIYRIFLTFDADDEVAQMEYTIRNPMNDYIDKNFVEELLSYQLVVEWLTPQVNTTTSIHQMITNSKEQKFYSQSTHMTAKKELYDSAYNQVRSMLRDRGYITNDYLDDREQNET